MKKLIMAMLMFVGLIVAVSVILVTSSYLRCGYIPVHETKPEQLELVYGNPEYIKNVCAYKEGSDGIVVYFTLADAQGKTIACNSGTVTINIFEGEKEIFTFSLIVSKDYFQKATVGLGSFQREVVACCLGRLKYSVLGCKPSGWGKVEIRFWKPVEMGGEILTGEDTLLF
jgi:nitrogen fixation protein FixH